MEPDETPAKGNGDLDQAEGIDKSVLTIATPRRYRNREHLRYVAQQACLICGRKQSDPHHLRYLQPRALGRKPSDEFAVPLCRPHHRAVHRVGDERAWWTAAGIDPVVVARQLWRQTRLDDPQKHQQAGLAANPETPSIASAPDGMRGVAVRSDCQWPSGRRSSGVSCADVLLNVATAARLFHASDGTGFADLSIDGHRETWPLRSKRFGTWLRQQYYERTWDAPSPAALNAALNVLEAQAQFDGPQRQVSVRLAEQDGLIYLDLADKFWRCIEIGANGWRIAEDPPVRFRRSAGMQPLPLPMRGGSIEALAPFLNLASDNDFVLVVAWLFGALRAGGPFPVLAIAGEQGSAKTVLSKLLRALIDPNVAPVRALPRNERELFIAAGNSHVLAFDNLSGLPPWLSDALCRLTSGGAFSTRRLFTDHDEILFAAARPIILNKIEEVITRPDLADRAILLMLAPIAERQRRPETALWREFELARPHILGALLDAAAHGVRLLPHVRLRRLPRMADFALWATACESAFRPAGAFEAAYDNNRRDAIESIVDADPVAVHVRELMADRAQWTGSASDLLQVGINIGGNAMAAWPRSGWPKIPAHSLAGCVGHRPRFAPLGLRLFSAARGGWERGPSG